MATGSAMSVPPRRYDVTHRPSAPMATAAAARPPVASTTPRRLGPSTPRDVRSGPWSEIRCSHHSEVAATTAATRAGTMSSGPEPGRRTASTPATPARPTRMSRPTVSRRSATTPATAASSRTTTVTEPTRTSLVGGAELPDRELLERGRRQVDDRRADREHGRGGGHGEGGDQVAGCEADDRREHAVGRVEQRAAAWVRGGGLHGRCSEREGPRMGRDRVVHRFPVGLRHPGRPFPGGLPTVSRWTTPAGGPGGGAG